MRTKSFLLQALYRTFAIGCMAYALTLMSETARAAALPTFATEHASHLSPLDSSR